MEAFTTELIPPPEGDLEDLDWLHWINNQYIPIRAALDVGYRVDDERSRCAFKWVADDLARLLNAACRVILSPTKGIVKIWRDSDPGDTGFDEHTDDLARVVAHRHLIAGEGGPGGVGFRRLSRILVDRLEEREQKRFAGISKPDAAAERSGNRQPADALIVDTEAPREADHTTKPDEQPEVVELRLLPEAGLTDRASIRAFVRSDRFHDFVAVLLWTLRNQSKLRPDEASDASAAGFYLLGDLSTLIAAAVEDTDRPLIVRAEPTIDRPTGIVRRLGAIVRVLTSDTSMTCSEGSLRVVYDLIDRYQGIIDRGE
jgi:hypothetical protein